MVELAVERCRERGHRLLIVDTISAWAGLQGEDENKAGAVAKALSPLDLALGEDIGVVAIHHDRKGGGDHGEAVRGSSAFVGTADVVTPVTRGVDRNVRLLRSWSRLMETPDVLAIELDEANSTYALVDAEQQQPKDGRASETDRRLIEALEDEPATAEQLSEYLGLTVETVRRHVSKLFKHGRITRTGAGSGRSPFIYHRVEDVE